jgi:hypothetical protein
MRYSVLRFGGFVLLAVLVGAAAGCGKKGSTVTGDVTYDGERVEAGSITFLPEDGQGEARSGPIHAGKYKVEGVPPGKKYIVQIRSGDPSKGSRSSPEESGKVAPPQETKLREDLIPPDAGGNNQVVEVGSKGIERHDFSLEKPKRSDTPGGPGNPTQPPGKGMPGGSKSGAPGFPK